MVDAGFKVPFALRKFENFDLFTFHAKLSLALLKTLDRIHGTFIVPLVTNNKDESLF